MSSHPVCKYQSLNSPVVFHQGRLISLGELLQTVEYLYKKIPAHLHLLNLYENRYYFLLGFLLGLKQQSSSLFPSTVTPHVLAQLSNHYDDLLILSAHNSNINLDLTMALKLEQDLSDKQFQTCDLQELLNHTDFINTSIANHQDDKEWDSNLWSFIPEIELNKKIAIIFTSGSTGQPKPYVKEWGDLLIASRYLTQSLFTDSETQPMLTTNSVSALLATVPAQHMYGLEASIIVALQNGFLIHASKPFFPQDIKQCLEELTQAIHQDNQSIDITVITTPLHLKACIKTDISLPALRQFISATAPLQSELAQSCESRYSTRVMEIFGCTEVGSTAYRRTIKTDEWTVLKDISLEAIDSKNEIELDEHEMIHHNVLISTERSIKHFLFNDIIELLDKTHFILKGRKDDLINIAGKRTSLAYLNHHIQSYEEFSDACFAQDDKLNKHHDVIEKRLVAFVVLKTQNEIDNKILITEMRTYLKQRIDSIFLPKKIYFIDKLPRNATGKLPQSELKKLISQQEMKQDVRR